MRHLHAQCFHNSHQVTTHGGRALSFFRSMEDEHVGITLPSLATSPHSVRASRAESNAHRLGWDASAPQYHLRHRSCVIGDPNEPVYDPLHGRAIICSTKLVMRMAARCARGRTGRSCRGLFRVTLDLN